jgi:hypothetical protein
VKKIFQSYLDDSIHSRKAEMLLTPKKRKHRYFGQDDDTLGVDDNVLEALSSWELETTGVDSLRLLLSSQQNLEHQIKQFKLAVGDDVGLLTSRVQELKAVIGAPSILGDFHTEECTTIWETFVLLKKFILEQNQTQKFSREVDQLVAGHVETTRKLSMLEQNQSDLGELLKLLGEEQDNQARLSYSGVRHPGSMEPFMQEISAITARLDALKALGVSGSDTLRIKAQLKLIEARLPTDPFVIGGRMFNSKADVALFVEKEMPGRSFSLFHDIITLMESVTDGHVKKSEVMAEMYQASRVGFDEDEATHVHSFKLIIPTILGAAKDGDKHDPKLPLPAVKDFTSWNPQDNEGGIKKRIQEGMDDATLAVTESISAAFIAVPEANKLATEMLYQSKIFINELCSWVDSFYMELIKTSQVPAGEAWLLVASCLWKFFEVLRK